MGRTVGPKAPCISPREQISCASCGDIAAEKTTVSVESRGKKLHEELCALDLEGLAEKIPPARAVAALHKSQHARHNVSEVLAEMVNLSFLEMNRESLSSVASGFWCWVSLALFKGHPQSGALPPRHGGDILGHITNL